MTHSLYTENNYVKKCECTGSIIQRLEQLIQVRTQNENRWTKREWAVVAFNVRLDEEEEIDTSRCFRLCSLLPKPSLIHLNCRSGAILGEVNMKY